MKTPIAELREHHAELERYSDEEVSRLFHASASALQKPDVDTEELLEWFGLWIKSLDGSLALMRVNLEVIFSELRRISGITWILSKISRRASA